MRSSQDKEDKGGVLAQMFHRPVTEVETHEFADLRRRPRSEYRVQGVLEVAGVTTAKDGVSVSICDVSEIGVRLLSRTAVPPASSVRLSMPAPDGTQVSMHGSVVRIKPLTDNEYELGIRFYEEEPMLSAERIAVARRSR